MTHLIRAKRLTGESTQGETTQGETTHGRNDSGAKRLTGETTRDHKKHYSNLLKEPIKCWFKLDRYCICLSSANGFINMQKADFLILLLHILSYLCMLYMIP